MRVGIILCIVLFSLPAVAWSQTEEDERRDREHLEEGEQLWKRRDYRAWRIYRDLSPETPAGKQAQHQLEQANEYYLLGLDHLESQRDERARIAFEQGLQHGPIDPHLFLDIGDIYVNRGLNADVWYLRYLIYMVLADEPLDPEDLDRIAAYLRGIEEPIDPVPRVGRPDWQFALLGVFAFFLLVILALIIYLRQGRTLVGLINETPDLHPQIAYAIGCIRHELLKHRLGVLGDVISALKSSQGLTKEQLQYLRDRLFGGESISGLWRVYLDIFDRLAGRRLYLNRRDREFRRARQAVWALEALRGRFESSDDQLADRLSQIRDQIRHFENHLKRLSERLCRSRIDGQLLREAVFSVQSEPQAAKVRLDEIRFSEPEDDLYVEVFRADLLLILRNLVRNAILALGKQGEDRRALGLEVALRTEPTGDESVLIKVLDTSSDHVTREDIYGRRFDRGFGLVVAAVTRYDGSIFVEPKNSDFEKAVVIRFFRAMGDNAS